MKRKPRINPHTGQPLRKRISGFWASPRTKDYLYERSESAGTSIGVLIDRMVDFCGGGGFNPSANPVLPVKAKETPKKGRV